MNVIITGASRGIGYQTALQFALKKTNKLFLISRNSEKLDTLEKECRQLNRDIEVINIPMDIEKLIDNNQSFLDIIAKHTDTIDVLINNAGYLENIEFEKTSPAVAQKIFNVNFFAAAELIRLMIPFLSKSPHAHIVNIGSMAGFQSSVKFPGLAYYSASKAALASLTECLADELKSLKIVVNCLSIGAVQTEMLEEAFPDYKAQLQASQMATFIANFALNGKIYFNGKVIPVSLSTP